MNFEEFWTQMHDELKQKQEHVTLGRYKRFTVWSENNRIVINPHEGTMERTLGKEDWLKAWKIAAKLPPQERFKPGNYSYADNNKTGSFHSAYVATLLKIFLKSSTSN